MSRYLKGKNRLCRREGVHLNLKGNQCERGKCSFSKKKAPPGMHKGKRKSFKSSNFLFELREKQKIKRFYNLQEKQFYNTFLKASKMLGKSSDNLLFLLERRLDSVLVRSYFASSHSQARQLISHGQVLINNKKLDIPSAILKIGDVIKFKEQSKIISIVRNNLNFFGKQKTPSWLEINENDVNCKIISNPLREDIKLPINEQIVVEFYSKR